MISRENWTIALCDEIQRMKAAKLILVRHGETEVSVSGKDAS